MTLKFGKGNAKLGKETATFSLPAGWTCPGALDCLAKVSDTKGKRTIQDGKKAQFRCFAASAELQYRETFEARAHNLRALRSAKTVKGMADLILVSLPRGRTIERVRIHVSGDFFSRSYVQAWVRVADTRKDLVFYSYTKSPHFFAGISLPDNMRITASLGSRYDAKIPSGMKTARVVFSEAEAESLDLPIDHDDSHAYQNKGNFALLIHGPQAKGSAASKARTALKGKGGYNRNKRLKVLSTAA